MGFNVFPSKFRLQVSLFCLFHAIKNSCADHALVLLVLIFFILRDKWRNGKFPINFFLVLCVKWAIFFVLLWFVILFLLLLMKLFLMLMQISNIGTWCVMLGYVACFECWPERWKIWICGCWLVDRYKRSYIETTNLGRIVPRTTWWRSVILHW